MHHYQKIIRDNVPEIKDREGKNISYHIAGSDEEYWLRLKDGFQKAIDIYAERLDLESLADVAEILDAIMDFKKVDSRELGAVRENKKIEEGGFSKRYVLDGSEESMGPGLEEKI